MKVINLQLPDMVSTLGHTDTWPHTLAEFTRSDHTSFWNKGYVSTFNVDSAEFRGNMKKCYHKMCDSPAQFSYKAYQFLAKHIRAVTNMANENLGSCSK